jgi:hypothetical protein
MPAHPSPAMGDLLGPGFQQLRDLQSEHEALACPLQTATILLALALEDPFTQRCRLNEKQSYSVVTCLSSRDFGQLIKYSQLRTMMRMKMTRKHPTLLSHHLMLY